MGNISFSKEDAFILYTTSMLSSLFWEAGLVLLGPWLSQVRRPLSRHGGSCADQEGF